MSLLSQSSLFEETEKALVLHSAAFHDSPPAAMPFQAAPPAQAIEVDFLDSVQRHWRLAAAVFAAVAAAGTFWAMRNIRPVYQADATIYVSPELAKDSPGDGSSESAYRTLVNQQLLSVLHDANLSEALRRLGEKHVAWKNPGETDRQSVDRLRGSLEVERVPDSYEISVRMRSGDPRMAAAIANSVAETFVEAGSRPEASGQIDRGTALRHEKVSLEEELRKQLDLRAGLAESLQVINPQMGTTLPEDQALFEMRQALVAAQKKRVEAEAKLAAAQGPDGLNAVETIAPDATAQNWAARLLERQSELRERVKNMLPSHPVRQQAEAELAQIDAELEKGPSGSGTAKMNAQALAMLRAQAEQSHRIELDLGEEIAKLGANIPSQTRNMGQVELVNGEIARIQERLSRVDGQLEDIDLRNTAEAVRIFALAQTPIAPAKSQKTKVLAMVFALALLLGLGLPVALDIADARIYDPSTIEALLQSPVVGMTIERSPETEQFADEHLRRLAAAIERGIANGARTVLLTGLKQPVPASIVDEISRQLAADNVQVSVGAGLKRVASDTPGTNGQTNLLGSGVSSLHDLEGQRVTLVAGPALVFSADAERLAAGADMTLIVVKAGSTTRPDLVRGASLLKRLHIPAVGVVLQDVQIKHAGRALRRDLKEYAALQKILARLQADGRRLV